MGMRTDQAFLLRTYQTMKKRPDDPLINAGYKHARRARPYLIIASSWRNREDVVLQTPAGPSRYYVQALMRQVVGSFTITTSPDRRPTSRNP
jgi:hypothetical protein